MKKANLMLSVAAISVLALTGCNDSDDNTAASATATFKDSVVEGLSYTCAPSGVTGKTTSEGKLTCNEGDDASFQLGAMTFGPVAVRENDTITPYRIFPDNVEAAVNLAQLLQSLDDDGVYDEVITIDPDKLNAVIENLDLTSGTFDTLANTMLSDYNSSLGLVSEEDAEAHMNDSIGDTVAPIVTLQGDEEVEVILDSIYTDAGATANDDVHGMMTPIMSGSVDTSVLGTYTIIYTATDAAGNTGSATRTIEVVNAPDTTAPVVTLTGDATVHVDQDSAYTDAGATADDNMDGAITPELASDVDTSVPGTYTVTYTATDAAGNIGTAERTVIVDAVDKTAPIVTLTGATTVNVEQDSAYTDEGATANDNMDGAITPEMTSDVDTSVLGTYTVTYTATDTAGNIGTATRTVIVVEVVPEDTTAPVVTLTGDATVHVDQDSTYVDAGATANDNIDGAITPLMTGTVDTSIATTYTITYTATDAAGNIGTATRTVIVDEPVCQNVNPITGECEDEVVCENVNPITGECEDEPIVTVCQNVNPITGACED